MRERLFTLVYPDAYRAARVRSAAAVAQAVILPSERQDIEQELLITVWQKLSLYDPRRGSLRAFVELIVARSFASLLRARRKQRRFEGLDRDDTRDIANSVEALERWIDIQTAVVPLTDEDRRLTTLLTEYSPAEASRVMCTSRSRTYRGISRIRAAFARAGLGPDECLR